MISEFDYAYPDALTRTQVHNAQPRPTPGPKPTLTIAPVVVPDPMRTCSMCHGAGLIPRPTGTCNGRAKLTETQVQAIRRRRARGEGIRQLGRLFGVAPTTVRHIVARETWRHVP